MELQGGVRRCPQPRTGHHHPSLIPNSSKCLTESLFQGSGRAELAAPRMNLMVRVGLRVLFTNQSGSPCASGCQGTRTGLQTAAA